MTKLLTITDAAQCLGCSEANVYALLNSGELPFVRVGKSKGYRIDVVDLERFIQSRKTCHEGAPPKIARPRLKHIRL